MTDEIMLRLRDMLAEIRGRPRRRCGTAYAAAGRRESGAGCMSEFGHAAVLGAGSWGTAFAKILADAGTEVTIWARRGAGGRGDPDLAGQPGIPSRRAAARADHRDQGRR